MKIGEVAERLGTTVSALRFYERQGLVSPVRSSGGTRRYTEAQLRRFRAVIDLAESDIPLKAIGRLASLRSEHHTGREASRDVDGQLDDLASVLERKKRRLEALLADIDRARPALRGCFDCDNPPRRRNCEGCEVAKRLLESEVMQVVWDEPEDIKRVAPAQG